MWYLVLYAVFALWVIYDSLNRRMSGGGVVWAIGTFLLGPLVLPIYLAKRPLRSGEIREGGTAWNALKNFAILWSIVMAVAIVAGLAAMSQAVTAQDSDAAKAGAAIGTMLGLSILGALWFFPTVGAAAIGFLLKKNSVVENGPTGPIAKAGDTGHATALTGWPGLIGVAIAGVVLMIALSNSTTSKQPNIVAKPTTIGSPNASAPSADRGPTVGGKWVLSETSSPMDGSKTVILSLAAENEVQGWLEKKRPTLIVRCQENKTQIYVVTGMAANPEYGLHNEYTVRIRLGEKAATRQRWASSTDNEALFAPNGVPLARQLSQTDSMLFEFTPFNASPATVEFKTAGLDHDIQKISNACRWSAVVSSNNEKVVGSGPIDDGEKPDIKPVEQQPAGSFKMIRGLKVPVPDFIEVEVDQGRGQDILIMSYSFSPAQLLATPATELAKELKNRVWLFYTSAFGTYGWKYKSNNCWTTRSSQIDQDEIACLDLNSDVHFVRDESTGRMGANGEVKIIVKGEE